MDLKSHFRTLYRCRISFLIILAKIKKSSKIGHFRPFWPNSFGFVQCNRIIPLPSSDSKRPRQREVSRKKLFFWVFRPLMDPKSHFRPLSRCRITFLIIFSKIKKSPKIGYFRPFWLNSFGFVQCERIILPTLLGFKIARTKGGIDKKIIFFWGF